MCIEPFINIPKSLFNLSLSIEAKYLYMLMLDRYKLSVKNDWHDKNGYYIYYTIEEVQKSTGKSNQKAQAILKELKQKGFIIRKRQGQGNPSKIYLLLNKFTEFQTDENHQSRLMKIIS